MKIYFTGNALIYEIPRYPKIKELTRTRLLSYYFSNQKHLLIYKDKIDYTEDENILCRKHGNKSTGKINNETLGKKIV